MIILPLCLKRNYIVDATHVKKEIKIQEVHMYVLVFLF